MCIALGVLVYNSFVKVQPEAVPLRCLDFLGATLFVSSVVPILVGLSLASNTYHWKSWQAILPLCFGGLSLVLFICRESRLNVFLLTSSDKSAPQRMLLDLQAFEMGYALITWVGALILGFVVSDTSLYMTLPLCVLTRHRCTRFFSSFRYICVESNDTHDFRLRCYCSPKRCPFFHVPPWS